MPTPPLPDALRTLLAQPNPAVVATLRRDGTPVTVATWHGGGAAQGRLSPGPAGLPVRRP